MRFGCEVADEFAPHVVDEDAAEAEQSLSLDQLLREHGIVSTLGRASVRAIGRAGQIAGEDWGDWLADPEQRCDWTYLEGGEARGQINGAFPVDEADLVEGNRSPIAGASRADPSCP